MPLLVGSPPRLRGAPFSHSQSLPVTGSPPRLRGALWLSRIAGHTQGITPAPAGSTSRSRLSSRDFPDHPRACGEHSFSRRLVTARQGSPPRLRGAHFRSFHSMMIRRITPAPAGSTSPGSMMTEESGDHPRACGEHRLILMSIFLLVGSPPRLRGARLR